MLLRNIKVKFYNLSPYIILFLGVCIIKNP